MTQTDREARRRKALGWYAGIALTAMFLFAGYQYYQYALSSFSEAFCLMDRANPGHEKYPCGHQDLFGWHETPP